MHLGSCVLKSCVLENGFVPVFPDGVEAGGAEHRGDVGGGAVVGDLELLGGGGARGAGGGFEFDAAAAHGEVEVLAADAGVAAGVGADVGGHVGDAERGEQVAQRRWFAGREHDAGLGEAGAEGADQLDQGAVGQVQRGIGMVLVISGMRAHPGEGDGELGLPGVFEEVFEVCGEGEGLASPGGEAEQGADADPPEAACIGAFRAIESPLAILFGTGGVEGGVGFGVVGFLIDDEALGAVADHFRVLVVFHRPDLDGEGGDEGLEGGEAMLEVAVGDELRVFAGDEQEVAEAEGVEVAGFLDGLVDAERGAQDRVVAREAAVGTIVDALVGEVEGREEPHGAPEVVAGEAGALAGERGEPGIGARREQALESAQEGRGRGEGGGKYAGEGHGGGGKMVAAGRDVKGRCGPTVLAKRARG